MPTLDRSLIAGLPPFKGMAAQDLDYVLKQGRASRYPKDKAIFEQDAEADNFFLLLNGHIRVVRGTAEGHQIVVRYISEGELFGIATAIGRTTYPASAFAAVDCVVIAWPNALWAEFTARFPSFGANAYGTIGTRLQESHTRVVEMATEQVEQRIAHALLRLIRQSGRKTEDGIRIDFPITRQDIAEMTGSTLHTVSRVLSAWETRGLVRSGRQKVTVTDPHGLVLIAENRKPK
jgi:CRP-like cAMP-binding protein